jgi:hypothetical protein
LLRVLSWGGALLVEDYHGRLWVNATNILCVKAVSFVQSTIGISARNVLDVLIPSFTASIDRRVSFILSKKMMRVDPTTQEERAGRRRRCLTNKKTFVKEFCLCKNKCDLCGAGGGFGFFPGLFWERRLSYQ